MNNQVREMTNVAVEIAIPGGGKRETYEIQFIYGLNADGLSPFERELADKQVGEKLLLKVEPAKIGTFFGNLSALLPSFMLDADRGIAQEFLFTVTTVRPAQDRDVVAALAKQVRCGSGNCGCGCS